MLLIESLQILDEGYQESMGVFQALQDELAKFSGLLDNRAIKDGALQAILQPFASQLYETMAKTLFGVLRVLQPESFFDERPVNFYFLPGYHSYFIDRRLFHHGNGQENLRRFGVGLFGDPLTFTQQYHDCCQIRWYEAATMPPKGGRYVPASPYHWFAHQQPRISERPYDYVGSFTVSVDPSVQENQNLPAHKVLNLDAGENSLQWGMHVRDLLNGLPNVRNQQWEFPDRGDRAHKSETEVKLRRTRCMLLSLWIHSVFCGRQPDWLAEVFDELSNQGLDSVSKAVSATLSDPIGKDWGDASAGRPAFRVWTTISLHPLVARPPLGVIGNPGLANRNIGWATFLSSVPLGLPFICVARQWTRWIHGTMRAAETSALLRNREATNRAQGAIINLSHEVNTLINQSVATVQRQAESSSTEAISYRRFVLAELVALNCLSFELNIASLDSTKAQKLRDKFLRWLLLVGEANLVKFLESVAHDVQQHNKGGARIEIPTESAQLDRRNVDPRAECYAACMVLIGEVVRNYCKYGPPGKTATWSANLNARLLTITIAGPTDSEPASLAGNTLANFLEALHLGEAKTEWEDGIGTWVITTRLPERGI